MLGAVLIGLYCFVYEINWVCLFYPPPPSPPMHCLAQPLCDDVVCSFHNRVLYGCASVCSGPLFLDGSGCLRPPPLPTAPVRLECVWGVASLCTLYSKYCLCAGFHQGPLCCCFTAPIPTQSLHTKRIFCVTQTNRSFRKQACVVFRSLEARSGKSRSCTVWYEFPLYRSDTS